MGTEDPAEKTPKRHAGGSPLLWVGLWFVIFLGLIVVNHLRHPEWRPGDLIVQSLLNSLPAAGAGLGMWAGGKARRS